MRAPYLWTWAKDREINDWPVAVWIEGSWWCVLIWKANYWLYGKTMEWDEWIRKHLCREVPTKEYEEHPTLGFSKPKDDE